MNRRVQLTTIPAGSTIRAGVPAEIPQEAIDALLNFCAENKSIISGRLGLMEIQYPDGQTEFTYTIGIECAENDATITGRAVDALSMVPEGRWPITIVPPRAPYLSNDAILFYTHGEKKKPFTKLLQKLGLKS